jgi:hypothetical protein
MPSDISDHLNRRLEQLVTGPGQDVGTRVCEAIEQRLTCAEGRSRPQEALAWPPFSDQYPFLALSGSGEDDASDVSQKRDDCSPTRAVSVPHTRWAIRARALPAERDEA